MTKQTGFFVVVVNPGLNLASQCDFFPFLLNVPCLAKIKGVLTEEELNFGPMKVLELMVKSFG